MPTAVIALDFDPILRLGNLALRLDTLGIAAAILFALAAAAWITIHTPLADPQGSSVSAGRLRLDDLLFVVLGVLPGALLGGRLGYALLHVDFYLARPVAIVDPSQGSLELGLAVAGGTLTGAYVASLLGGPVGRWLHVAAVPVLAGLGLGKLAMALGGEGQGAPTDVAWATAYLGDAPWGSLSAATPSHPAQIYEALATLLVLGLVVLGLATRLLSRPDGRAFFAAVAVWALARTGVAATWRDPSVAGGLRAGQLIALALAAMFLILLIAFVLRSRRAATPAVEEPAWPDPGS